ncbi:MAG: type II toxin-antitoxin system VapC family toxin [Fimbriimonadales bacterium]
MRLIYLDPSAWVKRYLEEAGSEVVDSIWAEIYRDRLQATCIWLGFTELVWVLQRRRNAGHLSLQAFATVYQQLRQDCVRVLWSGLSWEQVQASVAWIVKHNLNSIDALHLQAAISQQGQHPREILLVASDRRLIRAASAEGLQVLNPEKSSVGKIHDFLFQQEE